MLGKQEKPLRDIKLILLPLVTIIQVHDTVEFSKFLYRNYITIILTVYCCLQKNTMKIGTKSVQQTSGEYDFAGH